MTGDDGVVDRDLAEHDHHHDDADEDRGQAGQRRHDGEGRHLQEGDDQQDGARAVAVDQRADDDLRETGDGEDHAGDQADGLDVGGDLGQPFLEQFRQGQADGMEDDAAEQDGQDQGDADADQHAPFQIGIVGIDYRLLRRRRFARLVAAEGDIGQAGEDRDNAGHDEGDAPVVVVDQEAGRDRRHGDAHVAPDAVDAKRQPDLLLAVDHHGDAHRVIDRREDSDQEQRQHHLHRALREAHGDGGQADADEEGGDHALT